MDISVDSSSCYSKGKYLTSPSIALGSGTNLQGGGCLEGGLCIALTLSVGAWKRETQVQEPASLWQTWPQAS